MLKKNRHEEAGVAPCAECHELGIECETGDKCDYIKERGFRNYDGIRLTADGFDCAMPVAIDSHSACAYNCLYCFSDNILGHATNVREQPKVGRTSLKAIERVFSGQSNNKMHDIYRKALKYHDRNENGYPAPVQLGALCDPLDNIEQYSGWLREFLKIAIKYDQPVRMSTKGIILLLDEYWDIIKQKPEIFWVAFSIITSYDDLLEMVDEGCPNATQRLRLMEKLNKIGCKTSLRFRPMIPGISDHKNDPDRLVDLAGKAGADAVSYEVMFYPMTVPKDKREDWAKLNLLTGMNLKELYKQFGKTQACTRPPYTWTEPVMHRVKEKAHEHGMTCGVSDPAWKQLSDVGCCCGIEPDDPVFGNWERENATMAIVNREQGRRDDKITVDEIIPPWAEKVKHGTMCNLGAGPKVAQAKRYRTWADNLREIWNNPTMERSPANYFQRAVVPVGEDDNGNLIYEYKGLKRQYKDTVWNVECNG